MHSVLKGEMVTLVPATGVEPRDGLRCTEHAEWLRVKVVVPINDNDIERCRRCDGGKYSLKKVQLRRRVEIH